MHVLFSSWLKLTVDKSSELSLQLKTPLLNPAEIWLDWLKDEIRLTEEEPNREKVYELFETAVNDYICECIPTLLTAFDSTFSQFIRLTFNLMSLYSGPEIWLEFAQYSIGGMGSPGGMDKVRSIFERAVTAVGLHMTKGQTVWEAYREFENAILSTVQVCVPITRISSGPDKCLDLIAFSAFAFKSFKSKAVLYTCR